MALKKHTHFAMISVADPSSNFVLVLTHSSTRKSTTGCLVFTLKLYE